jgi:hypothetical protein
LQLVNAVNHPTGTKTKTKNMTTLPVKNSITRSPLRRGLPRVQPIWIIRGLLLIVLALACFALLPTVRAQLPSPTPDGGYPNGNTAEGTGALQSLTTGSSNTAIGFRALFKNTTGEANTATGEFALASNTTGGFNTATGVTALFRNTTGVRNTATGLDALALNTTGNDNTANGGGALTHNNAGNQNTANGGEALALNTSGSNNTANGFDALFFNTIGVANTATGVSALQNNRASNNTANGFNALFSNTDGRNNTANGVGALTSNTTGDGNIALGFSAGANLTTGSNNIDIWNLGVAGEGHTIRIGTKGTHTNTFVAGIHGVTVASAVGVVVDVNGHLGTVTSSARFKDAIKPMDKASEAILQLQPVTFRYKHELDPDGIPQFGLIAEQVEKVNPNLVVRDEDGKVNTVRYEAVNAMLLNEFLKEHRRVEEQGATIAQQKKDFASELARQQKDFDEKFAQQQKQIEALTATVQKVSDQIALSKPTPQLVANP